MPHTLRGPTLETILDRVTLGVLIVDLDMKLVFWNGFLAVHSGRAASDLLGRDLFEAFPELPRPWLERKIRNVAAIGNVGFTSWQQRPFLFRLPHHRLESGAPESMRQDCTFFSIAGEGGDCEFVCILVADVTDVSISQERLWTANRGLEQSLRDLAKAEQEARAREIELRHAQKLEAVGRLAAGIAHEINTPIQFIGDSVHFLRTVISGYETILAKYRELGNALAESSEFAGLLGEIRDIEEREDAVYLGEEGPRATKRTLDGVERVAKIVRAMKEFAHPPELTQSPADINHAMECTLIVVASELKNVAEVDVQFEPLPPVTCYLHDLNQVFLNLLVNAAHAIADRGEDADKGRIVVRTRADGDSIVVSVTDTGCGIPEAIRAQIFDPFFTTKEVGRGTGQGLAISRSIVVDKHAGRLTFETEVGKGTTFFVYLPIAGAGSRSRPAAVDQSDVH